MYQHIPTNRPITGIEIGVWEAHNSVRLLDKFPNLHITLIDPFEGYQDWWGFIDGNTMKGHEYIAFERLKPYVDRVNIIKQFSDKALEFIADESFDFIYIDGDHSYKWALHDITNYWAKVKPGGVLCGHDRSLSGVAQALEEFGKSFTPSEEPQNDSWYILKP